MKCSRLMRRWRRRNGGFLPYPCLVWTKRSMSGIQCSEGEVGLAGMRNGGAHGSSGLD